MNRGARIEPTPPECALAAEMFDHFCSAGTMKQILALHREICNTLTLRPNRLPDFYPKLKTKLSSSWKAQALFKKFDARANHKVYTKGRICSQSKVLIIGAGPCGLRAAIECQLLGAKVVVVEKRDRISRNNVLHLWPFVIHDLRALGAKKFFGKFCAGSIDHISIRQLQCILLKVALLLGAEIHEGVGFEELLEPTVSENSETLGWRARVSPADHPVSQYEFDCLIGADGKRNTLRGFKRKEFRGKLAMAITANFINRHSEQEASVPEISGVAFIFNQKFFKDLYEETGIDLENIVYYKDDTHYFVMTAKKHSLLDKGVLLNDFADVSRLLSVENVDRDALMRYAQEAARFSTDGRLPLKDFALNHYGEPDVALFDFTSMYAAENASMVYERYGRRLLCQLVGDSLLEPFWPTGSGCARGFLSALDASWAVRSWGQSPSPHPLEVIAERESIYRLLAQTTPENLQRDFGAYTLDPCTRYPNLNRTAVTPHRVTSFYDSDDPLPLDALPAARKRRREIEVSDEVLLAWSGITEGGLRAACSIAALTDLLNRYRPDLLANANNQKTVYSVLQHEFGISPFSSNGSTRDVPETKLRSYMSRVYSAFKGEVPHIHHQSDVFTQLKQNQQKEKHFRIGADHNLSMYSNAGDTSHSSCRKKRRAARAVQVSNDPSEYIRNKIGKLELDDITQLAKLIEGHDALLSENLHSDKQKELQDQILALLDPDDSPDPAYLRESLAQLLGGPTRTTVQQTSNISKFFQEPSESKPVRPPRKLKGLDINSVKVPDLSEFFDDEPTTKREGKKAEFVRSNSTDTPKMKTFTRSTSTESPLPPPGRRLSDTPVAQKTKKFTSQSSLTSIPLGYYGRSHSIGSPEMEPNTKRITQMFEGYKRRHTPSPETRKVRSGSIGTPEMAMRRQRMVDIIEGKSRHSPSPDCYKRSENIGPPEMAYRKQRVAELIKGQAFNEQKRSPEPPPKKDGSQLAFRMQRVSDIMQKKNAEGKRPKGGGKRKAAREIMKQRFEKSVQLLATEPRLEFAPSADLENDYGLQQYRASAPQFGERVKKLERKLQHYEEGRPVGIGSRTLGGGARVAKLAAELSGNNNTAVSPRASKPKDLMRSVGKIERDDWNVREIEKKIKENRLGRPEPKTAEKVPKWDREQFLGRQKKLKEGENEEKWSEIDETLQKLDQKLRDSGRPDQGTKKVANLATKFVKTDQHPVEPIKPVEPKEPFKKSWRGPSSTGMQCAACGTRVFAAEGVIADGLHLHRSCFRCAVCKTVLRPGNYTMERYGTRLVCLRHSGVSVTDAITALTQSGAKLLSVNTPERISIEVSDSGAREIDEDEWTDRNCLASETSGAGGLSDEEDSSSDDYTDAADSDNEADQSPEPAGLAVPPHCNLYCSDDSFGYDDYSDDGAESSGNESCSRMREAREARRREVPADARPPTDSSELESEEESESSDEELSSATKVSTDSEFAREECMIGSAPPPAILITEVVNPAPPPQEFPLSRTRSAGGLATKRALELKRKYLLGEPSPPAVRKSDSTSQLDTKLEAFRSNITEFQKMLHPAPTPPAASSQIVLHYSLEEKKSQPMPDIIKNLCKDAPVDLLTKGDLPLRIEDLTNKNKWAENALKEESKEDEQDMDTDSLSEEPSSHTQTAPNQTVPRVEVHDEGGELVQMNSLTIDVNSIDDNDEKMSGTATITGPTVVAAESESSESCRDANTLMLTETELSDWAAESAVLDDCGFDEKTDKKKHKTLSGPKMVHEAKNLSTASSHVCGRASPPEPVVYSNALEHFEFADEGEPDLSIETPVTPRNEGYMELVDDDYDPYAINNDRSMNFIERRFADTVFKPAINQESNENTNTYASKINTRTNSAEHKESENSVEITTEFEKSKTSAIDDNVNKSDLKSTENDSVNISLSSSCKSASDLLTETVAPKITQNDNNNQIEINNSPLKSPEVIAAQTSRNNNICRSASENFHRNLLTLLLEENTEILVVNPQVKSDYAFGESSSYLTQDSPRKEIPKKDVNDREDSMSPISPPVVSSAPINSKPLEPSYKSSIQLTHNEDLIKKYFYMLPTPSPTNLQGNSSDISETVSPLKNKSINTMRLYSPAICRSASENFHKNMSTSMATNVLPTNSTSRTIQDSANKVQEIKREREEQTDIVRRLVLERLGTGPRVNRKSSRRTRASPISNIPPPVPPPPDEESPPPRPAPPLMPLPVTPSFSDPELARERRSKGIIKSISSYLNRRLGPRHKWVSEPDMTSHEVGQQSRMVAHKSTGALQEPPPVPPPPAAYQPPTPASSKTPVVKRAHNHGVDADERDAMQLWFEARWSRLLAQRKARDESRDEPAARRVARLERRLSRPLSAVEQAATVAELVNVCAQRDAHKALIEADKRRSGSSSGIGDSRS